jgi:hypothetical protein
VQPRVVGDEMPHLGKDNLCVDSGELDRELEMLQ